MFRFFRQGNLQSTRRRSASCPNLSESLVEAETQKENKTPFKSVNSSDSSEDDSPSKFERRKAQLSVRRVNSKEKEKKQNMEKNLIAMDDYYGKLSLLKTWLQEERKKNVDNLSSPKLKSYFKTFIKLWNKRKLPAKYYKSCSVNLDSEDQVQTPCSDKPKHPVNFLSSVFRGVKSSTDVEPPPPDLGGLDVAPGSDSPFCTFGDSPAVDSPFSTFGKTSSTSVNSPAWEIQAHSKTPGGNAFRLQKYSGALRDGLWSSRSPAKFATILRSIPASSRLLTFSEVTSTDDKQLKVAFPGTETAIYSLASALCDGPADHESTCLGTQLKKTTSPVYSTIADALPYSTGSPKYAEIEEIMTGSQGRIPSSDYCYVSPKQATKGSSSGTQHTFSNTHNLNRRRSKSLEDIYSVPFKLNKSNNYKNCTINNQQPHESMTNSRSYSPAVTGQTLQQVTSGKSHWSLKSTSSSCAPKKEADIDHRDSCQSLSANSMKVTCNDELYSKAQYYLSEQVEHGDESSEASPPKLSILTGSVNATTRSKYKLQEEVKCSDSGNGSHQEQRLSMLVIQKLDESPKLRRRRLKRRSSSFSVTPGKGLALGKTSKFSTPKRVSFAKSVKESPKHTAAVKPIVTRQSKERQAFESFMSLHQSPHKQSISPVKSNPASSPVKSSPVGSPNKMSSPVDSPNKMLSPVSSIIKVSSSVYLPNKILSPVGSPNKISNPVCSPNKMLSPVDSPNKISSPVGSPNKMSSPVDSPNKMSSPVGSPKKISVLDSSPLQVSNSPKPSLESSSSAKSAMKVSCPAVSPVDLSNLNQVPQADPSSSSSSTKKNNHTSSAPCVHQSSDHNSVLLDKVVTGRTVRQVGRRVIGPPKPSMATHRPDETVQGQLFAGMSTTSLPKKSQSHLMASSQLADKKSLNFDNEKHTSKNSATKYDHSVAVLPSLIVHNMQDSFLSKSIENTSSDSLTAENLDEPSPFIQYLLDKKLVKISPSRDIENSLETKQKQSLFEAKQKQIDINTEPKCYPEFTTYSPSFMPATQKSGSPMMTDLNDSFSPMMTDLNDSLVTKRRGSRGKSSPALSSLNPRNLLSEIENTTLDRLLELTEHEGTTQDQLLKYSKRDVIAQNQQLKSSEDEGLLENQRLKSSKHKGTTQDQLLEYSKHDKITQNQLKSSKHDDMQNQGLKPPEYEDIKNRQLKTSKHDDMRNQLLKPSEHEDIKNAELKPSKYNDMQNQLLKPSEHENKKNQHLKPSKDSNIILNQQLKSSEHDDMQNQKLKPLVHKDSIHNQQLKSSENEHVQTLQLKPSEHKGITHNPRQKPSEHQDIPLNQHLKSSQHEANITQNRPKFPEPEPITQDGLFHLQKQEKTLAININKSRDKQEHGAIFRLENTRRTKRVSSVAVQNAPTPNSKTEAVKEKHGTFKENKNNETFGKELAPERKPVLKPSTLPKPRRSLVERKLQCSAKSQASKLTPKNDESSSKRESITAGHKREGLRRKSNKQEHAIAPTIHGMNANNSVSLATVREMSEETVKNESVDNNSRFCEGNESHIEPCKNLPTVKKPCSKPSTLPKPRKSLVERKLQHLAKNQVSKKTLHDGSSNKRASITANQKQDELRRKSNGSKQLAKRRSSGKIQMMKRVSDEKTKSNRKSNQEKQMNVTDQANCDKKSSDLMSVADVLHDGINGERRTNRSQDFPGLTSTFSSARNTAMVRTSKTSLEPDSPGKV